MMVPGSNLLNMAMSVIQKQAFQYFAFKSREDNGIGQDITVYQTPVTRMGSIQAVPRNLYEQMGLDLQRTYVNIYLSRDVTDINRDVAGDQVIFKGAKYEALSQTDWFGMDGWDAVLCVKVS